MINDAIGISKTFILVFWYLICEMKIDLITPRHLGVLYAKVILALKVMVKTLIQLCVFVQRYLFEFEDEALYYSSLLENYVAYTDENHTKKSLFSLFIKVNIYKEIWK